jgi:hypothetical protein
MIINRRVNDAIGWVLIAAIGVFFGGGILRTILGQPTSFHGLIEGLGLLVWAIAMCAVVVGALCLLGIWWEKRQRHRQWMRAYMTPCEQCGLRTREDPVLLGGTWWPGECEPCKIANRIERRALLMRNHARLMANVRDFTNDTLPVLPEAVARAYECHGFPVPSELRQGTGK